MRRSSRCRSAWAWGGLTGALLFLGSGCANSGLLVQGDAPKQDGLVRAQTPSPTPTPQPMAARSTSPTGKPAFVATDGTRVYQAADGSYYSPQRQGASYCPPRQGTSYCPPQGATNYCPPRGMRHHGHRGRSWGATHGGIRQSYTFVDPGMPVYPPGTGPGLTGPGSPAAIIQYPYYTTKGPDDFFLDEDGVY